MIVEHLAKVAGILDSLNTIPAKQAAEGIDTVLGFYAEAAEKAENAGPSDTELTNKISATLSKIERPLNNVLEQMRRCLKECARDGSSTALHIRSRLVPSAHKLEDLAITIHGLASGPASIEATASNVLGDLVRVADMFDEEGLREAAGILDSIVREAAELPSYPGRWETRKDLYDSKTHNEESMYEVTRREVDENRKQHHVEPYGEQTSNWTRYSPELPGVTMMRVSDGVYQDPVTKKTYNFNQGWTDEMGQQNPGGSISHQTPQFAQYKNPSRLFESRVHLNKARG